ncbi:threonine ammonia-lyase, biosynthetic [Rheinheimera nanhaiensis]|uniref:L-threonine dehydratase n=1 Tax=Rheinheimera nanhaiensis E407-8 TaxID=562729 RepID=I1E0Q1_9GAMM|nr:threonine ammonia-lyase, biosynthetic [Rheinheimera nanhaiensis]GAB59879.1 threonine dehydratase biosynthetic [Rheinheimera nanhaiensis E407-8]
MSNLATVQRAQTDTELMQQYLREILLSPVYQAAVETPLDAMAKLSQRLGHNVLLKREDKQPVYSFKLRGAFHKLHKVQQQNPDARVVCASAGNHAQGVALSASKLGLNATIVMPITTPEIKVAAVKALGGNVVLHGTAFDEANSYAINLANTEGAVYIPPFDDNDVIAGQGTVAKELLSQHNQLNAVFIPVGGGGLMAGMAVYIKAIQPNVKVIGVEPEDAACLKAALDAGAPVTLSRVGLFADGVAVKRIGTENFNLAKRFCDEVVTVSSDEICAAIKDIFDDLRAVAEPAGALALAGLKKYSQQLKNSTLAKPQQLAAVLSGANLNFDTLRYVSERCELGEKKEAVFAVTIPEEKGSFRRFCQTLGGRAITEFNYRYASDNKAHIFVGIKLRHGQQELNTVKELLSSAGYAFQDLSDDELAKLHVRHMVGGMPPRQLQEQVYQFNFPEYPGALMNFLNTLGEHCNITLFHYRNHGAATGDVLAGFEVASHSDIASYLDKLGYQYQQVSHNRSYQTFLTAG